MIKLSPCVQRAQARTIDAHLRGQLMDITPPLGHRRFNATPAGWAASPERFLRGLRDGSSWILRALATGCAYAITARLREAGACGGAAF